MTKPFDRVLHKENDQPAKVAVKKHLIAKGYVVNENVDIYGIDLKAIRDGVTLLIEVEIKKGWKGGRFPFKTVRIPKRKDKFIEDTDWFFVLSKDRKRAVAVKKEILQEKYIDKFNNKYMLNEPFASQPCGLCINFSPYRELGTNGHCEVGGDVKRWWTGCTICP